MKINARKWQTWWAVVSAALLIYCLICGFQVLFNEFPAQHVRPALEKVLALHLTPDEKERCFAHGKPISSEAVVLKVVATDAIMRRSYAEAQDDIIKLLDPNFMTGTHQELERANMARESPIASAAYSYSTTVENYERAARTILDPRQYEILKKQSLFILLLLWAGEIAPLFLIWAIFSIVLFLLGFLGGKVFILFKKTTP